VDQIKLFTKAAVMPSTILTGNNFSLEHQDNA